MPLKQMEYLYFTNSSITFDCKKPMDPTDQGPTLTHVLTPQRPRSRGTSHCQRCQLARPCSACPRGTPTGPRPRNPPAHAAP